jgi:hypothetical protein
MIITGIITFRELKFIFLYMANRINGAEARSKLYFNPSRIFP